MKRLLLLILGAMAAFGQTDIAGSRRILGNQTIVGTENFCADAGANDTYTCSISPAITAYTTGAQYAFKANTANTGAASINFNSLGALTIKKKSSGSLVDLADNDIGAGNIVVVRYDGTYAQVTSIGSGAAGGGYATIQDEGSGLTARTIVNFVGAGITCTDNSGSSRTDCTISTSGYATVQDEGSALTTRTIINFIGSGVACVDNAGATRTDCTITSAGYSSILDEGSALTARTVVNFIGAGVACVDNSGASRTDCTITSGGGSYTPGDGMQLISGTQFAVDSSVPTFLTNTATLDFGSISASACAELTMTLTGAATGDSVIAGWPLAMEAGLLGQMTVTSASTVTVRLCKITTGAVDPASQVFRASVVRGR